MGLEQFLKRALEREERDAREDQVSGTGGFRHSRFYHSQFAGYREIRVPRADGRGYRTERRYVGDFFREELPEAAWKRRRAELCLWYAGILVCYVLAARMNVPLNHLPWVELPLALMLPVLGVLLIGLCEYVPAGRELKLPEYRNGVLLLLRAAGLGWIPAAAAFAGAVFGLTAERRLPERAECLFLLLLPVTAGLVLGFRMRLSGVRHTRLPAEDQNGRDL